MRYSLEQARMPLKLATGSRKSCIMAEVHVSVMTLVAPALRPMGSLRLASEVCKVTGHS